MQRWHSLLDIVSFPLKLLFFAVVLMGLGGLILNPNLATLITIDNQIIILLANLFRYFGGIAIIYFPLLVMIKSLSKRFDDSVPVFVGLIGYFIFNITTMFFTRTNLPSSAYYQYFGFQIDISNIALVNPGTRIPLETGFIGVLIVILITRYAYRVSRRALPYGLFAFVDKDSWSALITFLLSILSAIAIAFIWPFFIEGLYFVFRFIASDITNPVNLFVYGMIERLLSILSLARLIRTPFWFGSFGGSWIDVFGTNFTGDIAIWTAQVSRGLTPIGFGRLISPYYVLNIFAIPAFALALYQTFTDKFERRKYRLFLFIAVFLSITVGLILPFEFLLLFVAPLIYAIHVVLTGFIFALLEALNIAIGYNFSGLELVATPASIVDILIYFRNPVLQRGLTTLLIIGPIISIIYYFIAKIYFNVLAIDAMNTGKKERLINGVIEVFGGLDNIRMIHASFYRLSVLPFNKNKVDFSKSKLEGVSKIIESKTGYAMNFGPGSYILRQEIIKLVKTRQQEILEQKKKRNKDV